MKFDNNLENLIEKFCYSVLNNVLSNSSIKNIHSSWFSTAKNLVDFKEKINFFRHDVAVVEKHIESIKLFGYYSPTTKDIVLSLSLEMKPPRTERRKFKALLAEVCRREGVAVDGYWFDIKKSYPDLEAMLASDVAVHANELLGLYEKMVAIRASTLE